MTLRVGIWAAVSSEEQARDDKTSIPNQLSAGEKWAANNDGEIVARYVVPGHTREPYVEYSEAAAVMDAYRDLKADLNTRALDVLHARSLDRLGRNAALVHQVVAYCQRSGVRLVLETLPLTGNPQTDNVIIAWGGVSVGNEIAEFRRKNHDGMDGRAYDGHPVRPILPFPYYREAHPVTGKPFGPALLDPRGRDAVREIHAMLRRGASVNAAARYLNALGFVSRHGRPFSAYGLIYVLRNSFLAGEVTRHTCRHVKENGHWRKVALPRDQWIIATGQHEPVFTPEEWADLQRLVARRPRGRPYKSRYALWSSLLLCAHCGFRMTPVSDLRNSVVYVAYRCAAYRLNACAHSNRISEKRITARILAYLLNPPGADVLAPLPEPLAVPDYTAELADLDRRGKAAYLAYETGRIDIGLYDERAREIKAMRSELELRIAEASAARDAWTRGQERSRSLHEILPELPRLLTSISPPEANAIMRSLLSEIIVRDGQVVSIR